MPIDIAQLRSRSRTVEIEGVGKLVVREPTLADATCSSTDQYWWVRCVTCPDGTPFLSNPAEAGQIRSDLAAALLAEVNRPHPTDAPSEGSGASRAPSNG
jgi:hypothetical protein